MAERPHDPDASADRDFAAANGWDREFETYSDSSGHVRGTTLSEPARIRTVQLIARGVDVA